ncbi:BNR-4 repeat-containing protein [Heminiphilus faecis]|uniref:BNR-4 repeat-containing protein n=1 Tax=Heminiphilus faecis TaxID=2601703 RepID=A0ABV4CZ19_9BACT
MTSGFSTFFKAVLLSAAIACTGTARAADDWELIWSEEFDRDGAPDSTVWNYETGFVRNGEAQWYQPENAYCRNGKLIIEGRDIKAEKRKNPNYKPGRNDWRNREYIDYTSASINTRGKKEWLYGRFEVRAKIPTAGGAWPAIWLLGSGQPWPSCGEIDMMEYYRIGGVPHILANACWGTDKQYAAKWNSKTVPFSRFSDKDPDWADKFHTWRMDWDEDFINLYLDDELLNAIPLSNTVNGSIGKGSNPFRNPQYLLLNLALGGNNGGKIDDNALPMKYEVDYVRVYKKKTRRPSAQAPFEGHEVTDEGAWCWFADPRALHYRNQNGTIDRSYIGYIDIHGNIKAMQYDFIGKRQDEVLVRSYFQPDDHNNPTFLVLPDERIMVFYSRHTDEPCFYYRVSREPGDITTLGEEKIIKTANNTTYPSPFILSDDPDHIYLCWRGIKWHPTIARLSLPDADDNVTVTDGPYQIVQSTGARPYAKYASDGKSRIYLTYTTGHPDNELPDWLYYNTIDINGLLLKDIAGNTLSRIADGPFKVNKSADYAKTYPLTLVDAPADRNWVWQIVPDKKGNPVIALVRISADKGSHDYYRAKWTGKKWLKTYLGNGGGHFHQTPGLEKCYSAGMAIDDADTDIVYCSMPVRGKQGLVYEIIKYTLDDAGRIVSTKQVTRDSRFNNIRPFMLPASEGSPLRLAWMHGDYYDWIVSSSHPFGYCTAINSDFEGFAPAKPALPEVTESYKFNPKKAFRLHTTIMLDSANMDSAILLQLGKLTYGIDKSTLKPYVKYGDKSYESSNRLATSDCWKEQNRGTGGQWYPPVPHKSFDLVMEYRDGVLTTRINGLVDQSIDINKH